MWIYIRSRNLSDFIKLLAEAIIQKFPSKTPIGKSFWNLLKGLRPVFTLDAFTGLPQIQISYQSENEKEQTLQQLLTFIDRQKLPVVVAIDEFQTKLPITPKVIWKHCCVLTFRRSNRLHSFSAVSRRHTLMEISPIPTDRSTQAHSLSILRLIDSDVYKAFISDKFERGKRGDR